jgi:hypothetical protein
MQFKSFDEFYPYYLTEHSNFVCRTLHFIGTFFVIILTLYAIITLQLKLILFAPLVGYGFAWVGHFGFEKNKPATFKYPLYSFRADFVMFWQLLTGKLSFKAT